MTVNELLEQLTAQVSEHEEVGEFEVRTWESGPFGTVAGYVASPGVEVNDEKEAVYL